MHYQARVESEIADRIQKEPDYTPQIPWARVVNSLLREALDKRAKARARGKKNGK